MPSNEGSSDTNSQPNNRISGANKKWRVLSEFLVVFVVAAIVVLAALHYFGLLPRDDGNDGRRAAVQIFELLQGDDGNDGGRAGKNILARWIQLVPAEPACVASGGTKDPQNGCPAQSLVRVIVDEGSPCPTLRLTALEGATLAMRRRANPAPERFPVDVCEALVPTEIGGSQVVFPDDRSLTAPDLRQPGALDTLVVIGDSGCRGGTKQPCESDPWPFARIARSASQAAEGGSAPPDLVIHVGDYVYGKNETWNAWNAEFFAPATPLLEAAPWIMVRGNHESCGRNAGRGYLLFLHHGGDNRTLACPEGNDRIFTPPQAIDVAADLRLVIADLANTYVPSGTPEAEKDAKERIIARHANQLESAKALAQGAKNAWLLTHVPVWAVQKEDDDPEEPAIPEPTRIFYRAEAGVGLGKPLNLVVAGDLHLLEWLSVASSDPNRPRQLIVGNSGVQLDPIFEPAEFSHRFGELSAEGWARQLHGYVAVVRDGRPGAWRFELRPASGPAELYSLPETLACWSPEDGWVDPQPGDPPNSCPPAAAPPAG